MSGKRFIIGQFAEFDGSRGGAWPATGVGAGQEFTFRWHLTARHSTTSFRYFITRDGYDPSQPLSRANLEPEPFPRVDGQNQQPPADVAHTGTLPNKDGPPRDPVGLGHRRHGQRVLPVRRRRLRLS